jgi:hypothetical protein
MDKDWLQKRDWDVYVTLETKQMHSFWAFIGLLGLVITALLYGDVTLFGDTLPRRTVLAAAPFFVFVMGGRFYFLSAYLFIAYSRVVQSVSAANKEVPFGEICNRLAVPDFASGLNLYSITSPLADGTTERKWHCLARLGYLITRAIALTPFVVHIGFTFWFYQYSVDPEVVPNSVRIPILILYIAFFIGAVIMCEYLRRVTAKDRDAIRAGLSSKT